MLVGAILFSGCNEDGGTEQDKGKETAEEYEILKFTECRESLKIYGRHSVTPTGITVDWSAGGIEFNAECSGDISITVSASAGTYFAAYINNERVSKRFLASEGENTFKIARGLAQGVYNVRFLKCANVVQANCVAESVKLSGRLLEAPAEKELLIEFIGDSIVCGYGVIDGASADKENAGTYQYCDATNAFGYLTAQALDADWRIEGFSGMGVFKGWGSNTVPEVFYKHTWTRNEAELYDFTSQRAPNVVVINLGTNDQCFSKEISADDFKEAVRAFVTSIRASYGKDMPIVWAHGMMNATMSTHVRSVLEELGGEASGYYMVKLSKNTYGGNGHPNLTGQETAAKELSAYLRDTVLK